MVGKEVESRNSLEILGFIWKTMVIKSLRRDRT
jgi:hypothetical protein